MSIEIRKARTTDIITIVEFQIAMALETEGITLNKDVLENGVKAVFEDAGKGEYWVAVDDSKIVGSMLMTPEWSDWRNKTVLWFQSVYVIPEYRRKGIFRMMYSEMKAQVLANDNIGGLRLYVDKTNIRAQKVYENLGMNGEHYRFFEWMQDF